MFKEWVGRPGLFFFFFLETFKELVAKLDFLKCEIQYLGCKNIPEQDFGWEISQTFLELPPLTCKYM